MSSPTAASPLRDRADGTGRPRRLSSRVPTPLCGPGTNLMLTEKAPDIARSDPPIGAVCGSYWVIGRAVSR
jgi:hypothetical protein